MKVDIIYNGFIVEYTTPKRKIEYRVFFKTMDEVRKFIKSKRINNV